MHKTINVSIRDKIAVANKDALYICGNSDFVVVFDFDDEWAGYEYKTARFVYGGKHIDVLFNGNQCEVPVMSNTYHFTVGVYAGDLHTTTPAYVAAKKSILCDSGLPDEPFDSAYAQMVEVFGQTMEKVDAIPEEAYKARDDAKTSAKAASDSEAKAKKSEEAAAASAKEVSDKAPIASPVFTGSVSLGRTEGKTVGDGSTAFGVYLEASGDYAHAEGSSSKAKGFAAHAEGTGAEASGNSSHAEGVLTVASGGASHAEGKESKAVGECSHAEGYRTEAHGEHQHVQGRYNKPDAEGEYAHIVGNGYMTENFKRVNSNAHTLDWDGNAWFAGTVEGTALILLSPSGKRFKITVDDNGTLSAAEVTE